MKEYLVGIYVNANPYSPCDVIKNICRQIMVNKDTAISLFGDKWKSIDYYIDDIIENGVLLRNRRDDILKDAVDGKINVIVLDDVLRLVDTKDELSDLLFFKVPLLNLRLIDTSHNIDTSKIYITTDRL